MTANLGCPFLQFIKRALTLTSEAETGEIFMTAKQHLGINQVARSNFLAGCDQLTAFYSCSLDFGIDLSRHSVQRR